MSRCGQPAPGPASAQPEGGGVVSAGSAVAGLLTRVPLSLSLSLKTIEGVASVDRKTKCVRQCTLFFCLFVYRVDPP